MIKKLCFSSLGILFFLMLVASVMKAQCPTDIVPTTIPWHDTSASKTVYCGLTGSCTMTVSFCWRAVPGGPGGSITYETFMYDVSTSGTDCSCYTNPLYELDVAMKLTFQVLGSGVPGCGDVNTYTWRVIGALAGIEFQMDLQLATVHRATIV